MKRWLGWGLSFLFAPLITVASEGPTASSSATHPVAPAGTALRSVFLSASINAGFSALSNEGGINSNGDRMEFLLLGTKFFDHWAIEMGGGWLHDQVSAASGSGAQSGGSIHLDSYDLVTDAAVAELSPQFRFGSRLQAGPLTELLIGPDVGFNPSFGSGGGGLQTSWLLGGQALYAIEIGHPVLRVGMRYLSSVGLQNHRAQSVQLTAQFGLPVL